MKVYNLMISQPSEALPPTSPPPPELHPLQPTTSRYNTNLRYPESHNLKKNPQKILANPQVPILWLQRHLPDSILGLISQRKILQQTHSDVLYKLERTRRRFRETEQWAPARWRHLGRWSALGESVEREVGGGFFFLLGWETSPCCNCRQDNGCKLDALRGDESIHPFFAPSF